jgi:CRISPR-associated endonuclease/helicase Cas3
LSRTSCVPGVDRIIVATQVVEAGVDISAGCVITELAPWPSLVQRFGRCARYGGSGTAIVVDRGRDEKSAPPYAVSELEEAWAALERIAGDTGDVGIASLEAFEEALDDAGRARLYPYEPRHLLLRRELDELFDTTPDLTGADLDISRFIRSGEERDLLVFWLDITKAKKGEPATAPPRRRRPGRHELCAVPFLRARDWLCGTETKSNRKPRLRARMRAWVWDWIDGAWKVADRALLAPGRIVCVAADGGGYRSERGFDPSSADAVLPVPPIALPTEIEAQDHADDSEDAEDLSAAEWKTIACHGGEVAATATAIAKAVDLPAQLRHVLALAGLWHDLGKAHPVFQGAIRSKGLAVRPDRPDLAKAPSVAWLRPPGTYRSADDRDSRSGFRHELASALALFAVLERHRPNHPALLGPWMEAFELTGMTVSGPTSEAAPTPCEEAILACSADEFDLLVYLVACHHGKVRVALHAGPKDQDYDDRDGRGLPIRGVRDGDSLPSIALDADAPLPALALSLEPASLGLSRRTGRSWRERTLGLLERHGPGMLAWLEALLIAADRRASRLKTHDPVLVDTESAT